MPAKREDTFWNEFNDYMNCIIFGLMLAPVFIIFSPIIIPVMIFTWIRRQSK